MKNLKFAESESRSSDSSNSCLTLNESDIGYLYVDKRTQAISLTRMK